MKNCRRVTWEDRLQIKALLITKKFWKTGLPSEAGTASIRLHWSPEQISNRLRREKFPYVSAESIYRFIYKDSQSGGDLWRYLLRIQNARSIATRPASANERRTVGH